VTKKQLACLDQPADLGRLRTGLSRQRGFTLVELLITMAIILTLAAIATVNTAAAIYQARVARAVGDIHAIGESIFEYELLNNQFPTTLADVGYGANLDPWGNPYQYLNFADTKGKGQMRKDRFLVPINTYFDLYSMGKDGQSVSPLTAKASQDDIIWANDGAYIGLASEY
jgi:general secretion pathway protein G